LVNFNIMLKNLKKKKKKKKKNRIQVMICF
jgi:hypothetical protein